MKKFLLLLIPFLTIVGVVQAQQQLWQYAPFEERANRATEIGLVNSPSEYTGDYETNITLLADYAGQTEIGGLFGGSGGTKLFAGATYNLAGSGVNSSASSLTLQSLTIPQNGLKIQDSDLSDIFYITLDPGNRTRQEIVSCTTVTQNSGGDATLSGCLRGLSPITPYKASTTLQFSHSGGAQVIFSDPPQLFNDFTAASNTETIVGKWTFNVYPESGVGSDATNSSQLVTKSYADSLAIAGAPTSSETQIGMTWLATKAEQAAGTNQSSTGAPLVLQSQNASSSLVDLTGNYTVITESDGNINQSFLDLTEAWTWTGDVFFNNKATATAFWVGSGGSPSTTDQSTGDLYVQNDLEVDGIIYGTSNVTGDGSDGDVTISGNTTLTSDKYYNTLTINNGVTLTPDGYKIFVKGTLTNNGTIDMTGGSGGNASNQTGGTAGTAKNSGTIHGGIVGGIGPTGDLDGGAAGTAGAATFVALNGNGVAGGAGGAGSNGAAGAGGTGGTSTASNTRPSSTIQAILWQDTDIASSTVLYYKTGAGSGSGGAASGGSTSGSEGGGGGGSGATGGAILIVAQRIINTGSITANGGAGGNGGVGNGGNAGGGGGGAGGNGGVIMLIYSDFTDSGSLNVTGGTAGTAGTGVGSGNDGVAGTAGISGTVLQINF